MHRRDFASSLLSPAFRFARETKPTCQCIFHLGQEIKPPSSEFLLNLPLLMEVAEVPGLAMSVVRDDRVVRRHHAGIADTKTRNPVSTTTLWPAASLGKPLFALAVLGLVDERKFDLDRPLRTYLPGYTPDEPKANRITARHVLRHSSRSSSLGLGWGLERQSLTADAVHSQTTASYIWHWGDNGSWKNFVLAHPATRSAIVIFTNGARGLHVAERIITASTGLDHAAVWWF